MSAVAVELEGRKRVPGRGNRPNRTQKPCPFTRDQLDSRTTAARMWDNLAANITADCGGEANISTIQKTLIDAFCAVSIQLTDMSARALLGQKVDLADLSLAASTLTRLAVRIGIARRAKPVADLYHDVLPALARKYNEPSHDPV